LIIFHRYFGLKRFDELLLRPRLPALLLGLKLPVLLVIMLRLKLRLMHPSKLSMLKLPVRLELPPMLL